MIQETQLAAYVHQDGYIFTVTITVADIHGVFTMYLLLQC